MSRAFDRFWSPAAATAAAVYVWTDAKIAPFLPLKLIFVCLVKFFQRQGDLVAKSTKTTSLMRRWWRQRRRRRRQLYRSAGRQEGALTLVDRLHRWRCHLRRRLTLYN